MDQALHFISGLPRSGSTLLGAILRQNPKIHAGMSSPVAPMFQRLIAAMGPQNEFSVFLTERQRRNILRGLVENYYAELDGVEVIIDTNRLWCARMGAIADLFPGARVIACVREVAWIMDSFERILRRQPLLTSKMFAGRAGATVFTRLASLGSGGGTVGFAWNAFLEAFYGEHAERLIVVDYEALTREPKRTIDLIYEALGIPPFEHDFDNVSFNEGGDVDAALGVPGLHAVARKVGFVERPTVLPPELFERYAGRAFWRRPAANPRGATVILPSVDGRRRVPYQSMPRMSGGGSAPGGPAAGGPRPLVGA